MPDSSYPMSLRLFGGEVLINDQVRSGVTIDVDSNGDITAIGANLPEGDFADIVDVTGLLVLPGVIDSQVHFRDPGFPHKEDFGTGTRAAIAGGVTAVFEMPNTDPPTISRQAFADKLAMARAKSHCDYGFFVGGSPENADMLAELETMPGAVGVKIFMGSSTGGLLVDDDETLLRCMQSGTRRVAIHAEDEAMLRAQTDRIRRGDPSSHPEWRDRHCAYRATERLIQMCKITGRPAHVLHITTEEEIVFLKQQQDIGIPISVEVTPQHLTLSAPTAYDFLGTFAQMNPPIRSSSDRAALWQGIRNGVVNVIGSDHAPHTREEKQRPYPESPSGMPGVQTMVSVMLSHVHKAKLDIIQLSRLWSTNPARLYGAHRLGSIETGKRGNFTIIDRKKPFVIEEAWLESRCGWSPFTGQRGYGMATMTVVGGRILMREGELAAFDACQSAAQQVDFS